MKRVAVIKNVSPLPYTESDLLMQQYDFAAVLTLTLTEGKRIKTNTI